MKVADVVNNIDKTHEYALIDHKRGIITIFDQDVTEAHAMQKYKRLFKILEDDEVEEVNLDDTIKEIVNAICSKIKMRDYLKNVLLHSPPTDLLEAFDILHNFPEAAKEVKSRDGCIYLDIPDPRPGRESAQIYLRY